MEVYCGKTSCAEALTQTIDVTCIMGPSNRSDNRQRILKFEHMVHSAIIVRHLMH